MSSLSIAGDTSGQITLEAPAVAGSNTLTLPIISDTITTANSTQTLTNKTLTAPVLSGTATGTYTLSGTPTISSPTITTPTISAPVLSGTATGTYTLAGTPTISSPTITTPTISAPVLSGTTTGTYTLGGTPTISAPVLSGTATGTYTLGGTPTISSPVLSGTTTGTYTLGGTPSLAATALTGTIEVGRLGSSGSASSGTFLRGDNSWQAVPDPFTTGDVKMTIKTVADSGWVLMNDGTIGNASSGGTTRANADTSALFQLLWNNTLDADCTVSGGRGGSAASDFAANKTISLPKALGRALACYGSGSGLTSRAMAKILGAETHILSTAEMPAHSHTISPDNLWRSSGGPHNPSGSGGSVPTTVTAGTTGGSESHNNMQPTVFLNIMIKL